MCDKVSSKIRPAEGDTFAAEGEKKFVVKKDQLNHFVEKVWGHEEWIANNDKYCGKKLVLKKGYACSVHHHKIKDETFYIASGKVLLEMEYEGEKSKRIMTAGDVQHIKIGMWHRFIGLEESEIFEFSTFHMDDDSYRKISSGKVDLKEFLF